MRSRTALISFIALGAVLGSTRPVSAGDLPSVDTRTWRPSTDHAANLVLEPVLTPGAWNWNAGAWLHYSLHPVNTVIPSTGDRVDVIDHALGADLTLGIGIGRIVALGASVPAVLYQDGSAPQTVLGDVGLHSKVTVLSNAEGGSGLALLNNVLLPTGARNGFQGDGSTRVGARILAEYTLLVLGVQASVGYTLRTERRQYLADVRYGDEIPWSFGVLMRPGILGVDGDNRQLWEVALHGSLPAGPVGPFGTGDPGSSRLSPMMLALSDRIAIGKERDFSVIAGVDLGLTAAVGVPTLRATVALSWAPREHDQDHDGVADDVDQCPEIAEDRDGFEDGDGCPEIDDDDDGIVDSEDKCPRVAGVAQPGDKNGCPLPEGKPKSESP